MHHKHLFEMVSKVPKGRFQADSTWEHHLKSQYLHLLLTLHLSFHPQTSSSPLLMASFYFRLSTSLPPYQLFSSLPAFFFQIQDVPTLLLLPLPLTAQLKLQVLPTQLRVPPTFFRFLSISSQFLQLQVIIFQLFQLPKPLILLFIILLSFAAREADIPVLASWQLLRRPHRRLNFQLSSSFSFSSFLLFMQRFHYNPPPFKPKIQAMGHIIVLEHY